MKTNEKKQWLADMYQQWADGGEFERLTCEGRWIGNHGSPTPGVDPRDWRIKPALKQIDLTPMIEGELDCEFWQSNKMFKRIGKLERCNFTTSDAGTFVMGLDEFDHCTPRISPHVHYWGGSDKCPVPEGFEVRLYLRSGDCLPLRNRNSASWSHHPSSNIDDIIGIEFMSLKHGYTF